MEPKEALALLNNIAAEYKADRNGHVTIQTAVGVLEGLIARREEEAEVADKKSKVAKVPKKTKNSKKDVSEIPAETEVEPGSEPVPAE